MWSDINSPPRRQRNNNFNENFTLTKSQSSPFINFKAALSDLEMCSDSQLFAQSPRGLVKDSESPPTLSTCRSSFSNMTFRLYLEFTFCSPTPLKSYLSHTLIPYFIPSNAWWAFYHRCSAVCWCMPHRGLFRRV